MQNDYAITELGPREIQSPLPATPWGRDGMRVLLDAVIPAGAEPAEAPAMLEASGPSQTIYFDPAETRAAIVTCGGLCPGLNDVIRAVTMVLWHRYGVTDILGLRYGYEGITKRFDHPSIRLTPEVVEDIHMKGGTILGSSRGPQDSAEMVDYLLEHGINILFAVGGDGTQRGALDIVDEVARRGEKIAVVGIPKTIDNDILLTDRTFGFETAVELCRGPITGAHMEAKAVRNGIGLVKLMGRDAGFVAAYATLASSDVNLVLLPEMEFTLEKVLQFLDERLEKKSHAVIVIAEGAGQHMLSSEGQDASGNVKYGDVGVFLKGAISDHLKSRGLSFGIKYIDPSYIIRSAPANADDSVFCFRLGERAAHAAMAGKTGMVVSQWNGQFVNVPMSKLAGGKKTVDMDGPLCTSLMDNTGQPRLA